MAQQFRYLFTPMKLGPVTVRNRIAFPAHGTGMIHGNVLSEQNMDYFAERARGGVGLIIREPENVHPTSRHRGTGWFVDCTDKVVLEHKKLAGAVHQHGAKIAVQLVHGGQNALSFLTERELWAPSPVGAATRRQWPKEMEVEDIREVVAAFARSARNAKAGEMDGCEIHAGHGYLLHEFITPYYNKRTDQYGGSLDNRLRVVYEVIDAIRKECGDDFMVGIRLSGDELVAGGLTPKDYQEVVRKLEDHGGLDYFHMSIGLAQTATYITPPMDVPPGYNVYTAAAVREVVRDTPVICVGRINDVLLAEKVLAEGHADMVGMVRALIADPELPNKAREGKEDDICHCVACLQGCHERVGVDVWLTCLTNPAAGREKELGIGTMKPAITKKKVMVVGSGPAGLEAARVAALRGHEVSLYEKSPELGGKVSIASKAPSRDEFMEIVRWRGQQLRKLGVKNPD